MRLLAPPYIKLLTPTLVIDIFDLGCKDQGLETVVGGCVGMTMDWVVCELIKPFVLCFKGVMLK